MSAEESGAPAVRSVLERISRIVQEGVSLSRAMEKEPEFFRGHWVRLVRAGELSGSLEKVLSRIADLTDQEEETRAQVRSALAYPLFIVFVGLATVAFLLAVIVPKLAAVLSEFPGRLPQSTRALLFFSEVVSMHPWAGLLSLGASLGVGISPGARRMILKFRDRWALRVPVVREWVVLSESAFWCRTLAFMLENGVPLLSALEAAAETAGNGIFRASLPPLSARVRQGWSLSRCLKAHPFIPRQVGDCVAAGEEGGQLSEALFRVADAYDRRARRQLKTAVSLLEPGLILVIGIFLGGVVISILLPILQANALVG
jgi:type II secretory pathway component PulF